MTQNVELKAGELVCFSEGGYSDYGYNGHFVALRDVSHEEMSALAEALRAEGRENGKYGYARDYFISRVISQGWVLSVNCREIHIGTYGELDLS